MAPPRQEADLPQHRDRNVDDCVPRLTGREERRRTPAQAPVAGGMVQEGLRVAHGSRDPGHGGYGDSAGPGLPGAADLPRRTPFNSARISRSAATGS